MDTGINNPYTSSSVRSLLAEVKTQQFDSEPCGPTLRHRAEGMWEFLNRFEGDVVVPFELACLFNILNPGVDFQASRESIYNVVEIEPIRGRRVWLDCLMPAAEVLVAADGRAVARIQLLGFV